MYWPGDLQYKMFSILLKHLNNYILYVLGVGMFWGYIY